MDTTQNTTTSPPPTAPNTNVTPPPVIPTENKEGNNKFIIFLIGITLFVLLGLGGFIIMTVVNKSQESSDQNRVNTISAPTIPPSTPTPASEEEEISNLNIEDPNAEIDALNQDLNSL
ncbi:hypothetical protein HYW54_01430 [Candidatus Gottesmanbacteria bacterium]|nr:hypothetical protein [Candidatus Gottesmanbacteria bacterium]